MSLSDIPILVTVLRFLDELLQRVRKPRLVPNVYTSVRTDPHDSSREMWALVFEVINSGEKPIVVVDNEILVDDSVLEFGRMYGPAPKLPHNMQPGEIWSVWLPPREVGENLLISKFPHTARLRVRFTDVNNGTYVSKPCKSTIGELAEHPRWYH